MFWPQRLLADGEASLVERLDFRVPALFVVDPTKIVEGFCSLEMLRLKLCLPYRQSTRHRRFCRSVEPKRNEEATAVYQILR